MQSGDSTIFLHIYDMAEVNSVYSGMTSGQIAKSMKCKRISEFCPNLDRLVSSVHCLRVSTYTTGKGKSDRRDNDKRTPESWS